MISTIAEIIRDLLIFVGVIAVMLVALVAVVTRLPDTNPLKRVLSAQTRKIIRRRFPLG